MSKNRKSSNANKPTRLSRRISDGFKTNNHKLILKADRGKIEETINLLEKIDYRVDKTRKQNQKRRIEQVKNRKKIEFEESYAEKIIDDILKKLNYKFTKEQEFEDLSNPETNKKLRFDFFLPTEGICIEYDGKQHFEYMPKYHGECRVKGTIKLRNTQFRDELKNHYCRVNNIKLIRLNHKHYYNLENHLKTMLGLI